MMSSILDIPVTKLQKHCWMFGYDIHEMTREELIHTIYLVHQYYKKREDSKSWNRQREDVMLKRTELPWNQHVCPDCGSIVTNKPFFGTLHFCIGTGAQHE